MDFFRELPIKVSLLRFSWFWKLEDGEVEVVARFLLSLVMFSLAGLVVKLMFGNTFDFEATKTLHLRRNTEGSPFKPPSSD